MCLLTSDVINIRKTYHGLGNTSNGAREGPAGFRSLRIWHWLVQVGGAVNIAEANHGLRYARYSDFASTPVIVRLGGAGPLRHAGSLIVVVPVRTAFVAAALS